MPGIALRVVPWVIPALCAGAAAIAQQPPLPHPHQAAPALSGCRTAQASVAFDFEGASRSACVVEGPRAFSILVTPEHVPPINPSPWYAFRYHAQPGEPLTVTVRYLASRHRYTPQWQGTGDPGLLMATVAEDGESVLISLPPGQGVVSAQELVGSAQVDAMLTRLSAGPGARRLALGLSHDGRVIEAVRLGRPDAPRLIVLLGRQHPPEVTGAIAMEAFADRLAQQMGRPGGLDDSYQVLVVPLLNPDGVARGHWRANLGGRDLNRDWGEFTQPETRAVKRWLDALPGPVRPTLMLDFHSTRTNLFYVQGEEASDANRRFLSTWLGGREDALPGYPFTIEPRDANPGSGTTKNWFHATYGIPAYTYEVADDADREATRRAATSLAEALPAALAAMGQEQATAD